MIKYRICKNNSGDYKIQQKRFLFWSDYTKLCGAFGCYIKEVILFKTKQEAEQKIIELKEQEQKRINDDTWEIA